MTLNKYFKHWIKLVVVLLLFFSSAASFSNNSLTNNERGQDIADDIASIISTPMYEIEVEAMKNIVQYIMGDNSSVKAVEVIDSIVNEKLLIAYKADDKLIYNQPIPENMLLLKSYQSPVIINDEKIGKVLIYYMPTHDKIIVNLTDKEKDWIKNHIVKVGVEQWDPIIFSNTGSDIDGIAGDIFKRIVEISGLKFKIINDEWNTLLNDFRDKKIDILPATYYTEARAKYGHYSHDYFKMKDYIFVKKENDTIHSMADLKGKTLAIVKGYGTIDKIQKKFPEIKLIFTKDLDESINRVLNGSVDALYEGKVAAENKIREELITGLKGVVQSSFKSPGLHFFTKIDEPILQSIIKKSLNAIQRTEIEKITSSWVSNVESINNANLNSEEQKWVKSNTIKMGIEPWAPVIFYEDEKAKGLAADFVKLVVEKTGLKIELINKKWDELLADFKQQKIDLLPSAYHSKERAQYGLFSKPFFNMRDQLYVKDKNTDIKSLTDLSGKSLAIMKGFATIPLVKNLFPSIKIIEVDNFRQAVQFVLNGQVDALLDSQLTSEYFFQEQAIRGLKGITQFDIKPNQLHLFSRIDQPVLQSILQKGLDAISRQEKKDIINDWVTQNDAIDFNEQEQAWLDKNIPVRYVYNPDWAPFEWTNDVGQHAGFISDILRLLKVKSGLNLEHVKTQSWRQATEFAKNRSADMYSAVGVTEERKSYMNFSEKTLFSTPYVFVSRQEENFVDGFKRFEAEPVTQKLAVVGNYTIHGIMQKNKADISLVLLNGTEEGFDKLLSKEIDVFLVNTVTAKYFINKAAYQNLKIAYKTDYKLNLHIAVRRDWPEEILSIINKTITSFDTLELNEIYEKWTKTKTIKPVDFRYINKQIDKLSFVELLEIEELIFAAFIVFLLAYFIYQNYSKSKFLNIPFNRFILLIVGFEFVMIIFIIYELMVLDRTESSLASVHFDKFKMVKLADELRQSSDDLTHFARSYTVTNNPKYKQNYIDILDIRKGLKPRPVNYDMIYWDLDPELRKHHHPDGEKMAFKMLIAKLPFSKTELNALKQALENSNNLARLEMDAFKVMEENNPALAIQLLHSENYHHAKAEVMHPIDNMLSSLDKRSNIKIDLLKQHISNNYRTIIIASILFILGNLIIYLMLVKKIREPLSYLINTILKIKTGTESIVEQSFYSDELGLLVTV